MAGAAPINLLIEERRLSAHGELIGFFRFRFLFLRRQPRIHFLWPAVIGKPLADLIQFALLGRKQVQLFIFFPFLALFIDSGTPSFHASEGMLLLVILLPDESEES